MNKDEFLNELRIKFPDAYASIDIHEKGNLHCEIGAFRVYLENEMLNGGEWFCEKAFKFINECLSVSNDELQNAIEISFIEDLALGEQNETTHKIIKERAPKVIRNKMVKIHEFWS